MDWVPRIKDPVATGVSESHVLVAFVAVGLQHPNSTTDSLVKRNVSHMQTPKPDAS